MTEHVLFRCRQLCDCDRAPRQLEDRVVTEAAAAARRLGNVSFPTRLADQGKRIALPAHIDESTAIARGTLRRATPGKRREQLAKVVVIAGVLPGIAGGVDA